MRPLTATDLAAARCVLAVKLSSFGDIVHVTPCLRALRHACPHAKILAVVDRTWAPLLRSDPHLDGVIEADPRRRSFLASYVDARRRLRACGGSPVDLAIDFQGLPRSAAWVYASAAHCRAGRGGWRPGWHITVRPDLSRHAVRVCAEVVTRIGIGVPDLAPRLFPPADAERTLASILRHARVSAPAFVVANPFARWRSKMWPVERWARLIERVRDDLGVSVVVAGGTGEEQAAARLNGLVHGVPPANLVGRTSLPEALCLYRRAALVISGDSGPMHAAAAIGTPVVALFGPTWPEQTGPWGEGHRVIQLSRGASHRVYRDDTAQRHMAAIDVDTAFTAVAAAYDQCRREDAVRASAASIRGSCTSGEK